jgi:hypothetical protein
MTVYGLGDGVSIPGRGKNYSAQKFGAEAHSFSCRGLFSPRVKLPEREANYSHPSNANVMNAWKFTSSLPGRLVSWYLSSTLQYTTRTKDVSRTDSDFFFTYQILIK